MHIFHFIISLNIQSSNEWFQYCWFLYFHLLFIANKIWYFNILLREDTDTDMPARGISLPWWWVTSTIYQIKWHSLDNKTYVRGAHLIRTGTVSVQESRAELMAQFFSVGSERFVFMWLEKICHVHYTITLLSCYQDSLNLHVHSHSDKFFHPGFSTFLLPHIIQLTFVNGNEVAFEWWKWSERSTNFSAVTQESAPRKTNTGQERREGLVWNYGGKVKKKKRPTINGSGNSFV